MDFCLVANNFGFNCFEFGFVLGMSFVALIVEIVILILRNNDNQNK